MNNITLIKKKYNWILFLLLMFCFYNVEAQTAPVNSRFIQINTPNYGDVTKSFTKHLNSQKSDLFFSCSNSGSFNFFGQQANSYSRSRHIARLGEDGLPRWTANFYSERTIDELNISDDFACVDKDDNFLFLSNIFGENGVFTDASGNTTNFPQTPLTTDGSTKALVKINKNGNYLWSKKIILANYDGNRGAITTDGNGDVYLILTSSSIITIDNTTLGGPSTSTLSVIKLKGSDGSILYSKNYNYVCFSFIPVFDSQNNLYVFTEPINWGDNYIFDSTVIPANTQGTGHLILKFNAAGNVIFGKDFYANASNYYYSWPNDVAFDGTNFILHGTITSDINEDFRGLDGISIPRSYTGNSYEGFFAKIDTSGNVLWQKSLGVNNTAFSSYTNIDLDENDNFYVYYTGVKDKLKINGTEYVYNAVKGEKVLIKFDTNGNQSYLKSVDFGTRHTSIDVFGVDKVNITSSTAENNILNYPVNHIPNYPYLPNPSTNAYVATFGVIDTPYLKAEKNYAELNSAVISNNENNDNTFLFDLINNVNWTATSDQAWLNISHLNLTGKNALSTSVSGSGDAKITLTADTNTGSDRSAIVTVSGNGVPSKTVLVTQSGTLGNPSNEFNAVDLILYPNPAHTTIAFSKPVKAIEIIDISGKTIKTFENLNASFDISNIAKGIYFIKGKTEEGISFTKKLIKE